MVIDTAISLIVTALGAFAILRGLKRKSTRPRVGIAAYFVVIVGYLFIRATMWYATMPFITRAGTSLLIGFLGGILVAWLSDKGERR